MVQLNYIRSLIYLWSKAKTKPMGEGLGDDKRKSFSKYLLPSININFS